MKHKLLSILLSLSLVINLLPTVALADEGGNESGGESNHTVQLIYTIGSDTTITGYSTIAEAAQAAVVPNTTTEKTIKLLNDINEDVPSIAGPSNFMLTIDLNGHNYTGSIEKYQI